MRQLRRLALLAALAIAIAPAPARAQAPYTFHTIAGLPPGSPLSYASGIAVDAGGSIYVFDSSHFDIRKVTPAGLVSIVAGSPDTAGSSDGVGSNARFGLGYGLAVDPAGNLYVADTFSRIVRKITPAGEVTTLAGLAGQQGSTDGLGSAARFDLPHFIARRWRYRQSRGIGWASGSRLRRRRSDRRALACRRGEGACAVARRRRRAGPRAL